ncbi:phage antirepressor N-terminal domain-containing protein [Mannheimia haemolytica]|nr:phage antirepressor N-terminal domain-containing protein [Mannheimia haemolytica]MDW1161156.1 phage antirepressor N-terminal domain-containing protein [Mannheimia haemolytica]
MSNQITTQTLSFHGSDLITLKVGDVIYTAVKPIVEAMGLDWGGQQQKLSKSSVKFNCRDISMVAKDGKIRQMLCIPIKKLNGWLFSINPEKVRADLKEKVICYQEECFEALYNYWHFGKAERPLIAPLVEPKITMELTKKEWLRFASMWFALYNSLEVLATLEKPLRAIGSPFGATAYTHATEYQITLGVMKRILEPMLADFEVDPFEEAHYHKALTTLRQYQPKGLGGLVRI